jgi:EAL domain-containing protein (putative c-di-GMP-specific phosphodiesterase class I)
MAREMKALGCDYLQGYLYSPPIPLNAFVQKYTVKKAD